MTNILTFIFQIEKKKLTIIMGQNMLNIIFETIWHLWMLATRFNKEIKCYIDLRCLKDSFKLLNGCWANWMVQNYRSYLMVSRENMIFQVRDQKGLNIFKYRFEMIRYFVRLYRSKIVFVMLISNTRKHAFLHITLISCLKGPKYMYPHFGTYLLNTKNNLF